MSKLKSLVKKIKPGTGRRRRKIRQVSYNLFRLPGLLAIFAVLLIVGVFVTNRWVRSTAENFVPSKGAVEKFVPKAAQHLLVPEDPRKYQVQVYKPKDVSLTQIDWNNRAQQLTPISQGAARTKQDAKALQLKIQTLDRQIKNYEKLARRNPSDYKIKENLQTLYMLRATLTAQK